MISYLNKIIDVERVNIVLNKTTKIVLKEWFVKYPESTIGIVVGLEALGIHIMALWHWRLQPQT